MTIQQHFKLDKRHILRLFKIFEFLLISRVNVLQVVGRGVNIDDKIFHSYSFPCLCLLTTKCRLKVQMHAKIRNEITIVINSETPIGLVIVNSVKKVTSVNVIGSPLDVVIDAAEEYFRIFHFGTAYGYLLKDKISL